MQLQWWIAYLTTILILMSAPGPSQILMLSNSMTHGYRKSLATLAGDLSANLLQMGVTAAFVAGARTNLKKSFAPGDLDENQLLARGLFRQLIEIDKTHSTGRARPSLSLQGHAASNSNSSHPAG